MRIRPTEAEDCIAFVQWLELQKLRFSHIPMETYTKSMRTKSLNRQMGVRAGLPDYLIVIPNPAADDAGHPKNTLLFIEMKREGTPPSAVSDAQVEWLDELDQVAGVRAVVARGFDEAVAAVQAALRASL